jgi:hypothetical protein
MPYYDEFQETFIQNALSYNIDIWEQVQLKELSLYFTGLLPICHCFDWEKHSFLLQCVLLKSLTYVTPIIINIVRRLNVWQ